MSGEKADEKQKRQSLAGMNYAKSGVSIQDQNDVNSGVKGELKKLGMNADGLFGGAVDITSMKGRGTIDIGVARSSIVEEENPAISGSATASTAISKLKTASEGVALLDYYASAGMDRKVIPDFVRGAAIAGMDIGIPIIGGESAQMTGMYKEGKCDAFVDVIYCGPQGQTVNIASLIKNMKKPLLCGSLDGTGTKTKISKDPRDIIYHGANDLGAIGVKVVGFSLYVAGNMPPEGLEAIVAKSENICQTLGVKALDATVEFKPDVYLEGEVDIAGTVIGVVDEQDMIKGEGVQQDDVVIGIAADCLMTNGYTLARKYCEMTGHGWDDEKLPGLEGTTIRKELSKPHVPYTDILFGNEKADGILSKFRGKIKATAHITGGGQKDNIERMVPDGLIAVVYKEMLPLPPIVKYFRKNGADMDDMYEAFNMGVGFTLTVGKYDWAEIAAYINDNFRNSVPGVQRTADLIGVITKSKDGSKYEWNC